MKKIIFIQLIILFAPTMYANMAPEGFERFPNYYFVETGTYCGDGIKFALRAGFPEIHSIEIDPHFYHSAKAKFTGYQHIHLHLGDSGKDLFDVIKHLDKPITFWLDGHRGTPDPAGGKNTPLMEELDQIKMHPIKTHTIVIDDMHCCGGILFDYLTRQDIERKVKEINPNYVITYVAGGNDAEYPNNIMVAQVP